MPYCDEARSPLVIRCQSIHGVRTGRLEYFIHELKWIISVLDMEA